MTLNIAVIIELLLLVVVWAYGYNLGQSDCLRWREIIEDTCQDVPYIFKTNAYGQPTIQINTTPNVTGHQITEDINLPEIPANMTTKINK